MYNIATRPELLPMAVAAVQMRCTKYIYIYISMYLSFPIRKITTSIDTVLI